MNRNDAFKTFLREHNSLDYTGSWDQIMLIVSKINGILEVEPKYKSYFDKTSYVTYYCNDICIAGYRDAVERDLFEFVAHYLSTHPHVGTTIYRIEAEHDRWTGCTNETFFCEVDGAIVYERDYGTTGPDHSDMVDDYEAYRFRGVINTH